VKLLDSLWQSCHFERIECPPAAAAAEQAQAGSYVLVANSGMRVLWGDAPSARQPNNADTAKRERLQKLAQQLANTAGGSRPAVVDIRPAPPRAKHLSDSGATTRPH
jgi:hypothetical protein